MRQRNYGIDLLRICCMLMIVTMHVLWQGGLLRMAEPTELNYAVGWAIEIACYCAVNCYGMISGYVGLTSRFRLSRILQMWLQVAFYAVGLRLVCGMLFPETINIWEWKQGLRPIGYHFYWYYSAYFCVSLCAPALNAALRGMRKRQLQVMLASLLLMLSVYTTYSRADGFVVAKGYSVLWLATMYMVGGYFRLYEDKDRLIEWLRRCGLSVYLLSVAVMWLMMVGRWWLTGGAKRLQTDQTITFIYPLVVVCAMALFTAFTRVTPGKRSCKVIGILAPAAFGVYLIHVHSDVWITMIVDGFTYLAGMNTACMVAALAATVIGVYAVCTAIELVRIRLFALLRVGKACDALTQGVQRWLDEEE